MKPFVRCLTLVAAAGLTLPAWAGHDRGYGPPDRSARVEYARVTEVTPITRAVSVREPHRQCWDERVRHVRHGDSRAGLILGGIIGGVVGNRFGDGDGRRVATVAGTLLGAGIGDELGNRGQRRSYATTETRCRTVDTHYTEKRTVGYRVHYRYHGEEFVTRMDRHPGDRIRVRVHVTPEY